MCGDCAPITFENQWLFIWAQQDKTFEQKQCMKYEFLLDLEQCFSYVGTSFGFLAAYIVYRDTIKKI